MPRVAWIAPFFIGCAGLASGAWSGLEPVDPEASFATRLLPLLNARCIACHGEDPDKIKGGLDLTSKAGLLKGGDSGEPAVVAGDAAKSPLYRAVRRDDPDVSPMPPKENDRLDTDQIQAFRDWINGGAPWPSQERIAALVEAKKPRGIRVATSGGLSPDWTERFYKVEDLWAYQPLREPKVPQAELAAGSIDAFLDTAGSNAPPLADRRTLARRVSFDLTGLPPTPEEIDQFVNDPEADDVAFTRVVDRLLASPHHGEQLASHWLDVTRYADSSGLANDYERGNAWRYRDYVVRSFNADKPYDQFVREQLAGDEIDPANPELIVATGFLRMGPWELTGMEVAKVARQRFLDDVTDTVGQVFLGQMLQCARCHDHKFDPVPTRDYYRIQAIFATTQVAERLAAFLPQENLDGFADRAYLDARKAGFAASLAEVDRAEADGRAAWAAAHPGQSGRTPPRHEILNPTLLGLERIGRKGLERLQWEYDRFEPVAHAVYNGRTPVLKSMYTPFRVPKDPMSGITETPAILTGGDPFSPGQSVSPGILSVAGEATIPSTTAGRRKALADWVSDPKNPLTPRVMANRIWQWTLGTPLANNPNNFGASGAKPTHPELLDWLAAEFIKGGWSVNHLQRQILMSNAYRSSRKFEAPGVPRARRLTAEELRDAMLAASGELNRAIGGVPVLPEIHPDVALQPRQVMGTFASAWEPSPRPEQRHRRSLYARKVRGLRDPFLEVFNAPTPDLSCEARGVSTVAPQALALFNGENTRARALAMAVRLNRESSTPSETIDRAFALTLGRPPTDSERSAGLSHWTEMTRRHEGLQFQKPKRLGIIVRQALEENTGEPFEFTEILPSAADFVPDLHPADASPETRGLMEVCLVLFNTNEFIYVD